MNSRQKLYPHSSYCNKVYWQTGLLFYNTRDDSRTANGCTFFSICKMWVRISRTKLEPSGVPGSINTRRSRVRDQSWRTVEIRSSLVTNSPNAYEEMTRSCCRSVFLRLRDKSERLGCNLMRGSCSAPCPTTTMTP
jgi:hypothetical protein